MIRVVAIAATLAFALPTLAAAQPEPHHPPPGKPAPRVVPHGPAVVPHGPPVAPRLAPRVGGPIHPGPGVHADFMFRGRPFHPIPFARPWAYPPGFAYRRWVVGGILPPLFWSTPTYYYADYAALGLPPPEPGFQWVQYGPDLVLVNVTTGQIVDVAYGVFY